jgi:cytochrome c oxidase assembly protein subunit 11
MSRSPSPRKSNTRTLILCFLGLIWGIGLTIAAVPLYRVFCQHFGIPVPQIISGPSKVETVKDTSEANLNRTVTIRFTANTQGGLPATFHPRTYTMRVKVGQPVLTAYEARNTSNNAFNGVAVHMLYGMGGPSGTDLNPFIDLRQCFCFEEEHYPAQTDLTLPLAFTVSPNLPEGIHTITFAYTLFESQNAPANPKK